MPPKVVFPPVSYLGSLAKLFLGGKQQQPGSLSLTKDFAVVSGHALTWNALFFWVVVPAYILVLDAICFIFVSTWSHWLNRWPESQQGLNKDTSIHNLTRNMSHVPKTIQVVVTLLHGGPQTGLTASVCVWRPSQRS